MKSCLSNSFRCGRLLRQTMRLLAVVTCLSMYSVSVCARSDEQPNVVPSITVAYAGVQPPYVIDEKGTGLLADLLSKLSAYSRKYWFNLQAVSPSRICSRGLDKKVDLIAFPSFSWGFRDMGAMPSLVLVEDSDLFFHRQSPPPETGNEELVAMRGFHYAFADFSPGRLERLPNVLLVDRPYDVVKLVAEGRVRRGIASKSFLNWYVQNRMDRARPIVMESHADQTYARTFVVLPDSSIKLAELNSLLLQMQKLGELNSLFARYGLPNPPLKKVHVLQPDNTGRDVLVRKPGC